MVRFFSIPCMWLVVLFREKRGHFGGKGDHHSVVQVIEPTVLLSNNHSSQANHKGDHPTEGRGGIYLPALCSVAATPRGFICARWSLEAEDFHTLLTCDLFADLLFFFPSQLLPMEALFPSPSHCLGAVLLLLMNVKCFGPAALLGGG